MNGCSESTFDVVVVGSSPASACCAYFLADAGLKVARLELRRVANTNLSHKVSSWVGLQPAGVMLNLSRMGLRAFRLLSGVVDPATTMRTPNVLAATSTIAAEALLAFTKRRVLEGVFPVYYNTDQFEEFHPCVEETAISACCFFEEIQVDLAAFQLGIERALNRLGVVTAEADGLRISKERSKPYAVETDHVCIKSDKVVVVDWKPCNKGEQKKMPLLSTAGLNMGYPGSSGLTTLTVPRALEVYEGLQSTVELTNCQSSNRSTLSSAIYALFRRNGQRKKLDPRHWEVPYCGLYPGDKRVVVVGGGIDVTHFMGLAKSAAELISDLPPSVKFPMIRRGAPGTDFRIEWISDPVLMPWIV